MTGIGSGMLFVIEIYPVQPKGRQGTFQTRKMGIASWLALQPLSTWFLLDVSPLIIHTPHYLNLATADLHTGLPTIFCSGSHMSGSGVSFLTLSST